MQVSPKQWDNSCIQCNQVITNPVCAHCLEKSVKDWLYQRKPSVIPMLESISKEYITGFEETHCVSCGRLMNLCSYCYTVELFDILKVNAPELVEEFVTFFHFDFLHNGYTKKTKLYSVWLTKIFLCVIVD